MCKKLAHRLIFPCVIRWGKALMKVILWSHFWNTCDVNFFMLCIVMYCFILICIELIINDFFSCKIVWYPKNYWLVLRSIVKINNFSEFKSTWLKMEFDLSFELLMLTPIFLLIYANKIYSYMHESQILYLYMHSQILYLVKYIFIYAL